MSVGGWRPRRWHGRASRCLRSARRSRIRRATADTVSQRSMSTWPRIHSSPGRGSRGTGAFLRLAPRRSLASSSRHGLQRARTVLHGTETTHGRLDMALVKVNGRNVRIDGPDDMPLLWALRDILGMTGTKFGCGAALCGAGTVHSDGGAPRRCLTPLPAPPPICTVHAPHKAAPHPNLVPVIPRMSRSAHSNGMSSGPSIRTLRPLTFTSAMSSLPCVVSVPRRTVRARCNPCLDELAKLLLGARRRNAPVPRLPRPGDEWILGHVLMDLREAVSAVARRILDLRADLRQRLALPCHRRGRQPPALIARDARDSLPVRRDVRFAVARSASQPRYAMAALPGVHRRHVRVQVVALRRLASHRVTVEASRALNHLAGLDEHCTRTRGVVVNAGEVFRGAQRSLLRRCLNRCSRKGSCQAPLRKVHWPHGFSSGVTA